MGNTEQPDLEIINPSAPEESKNAPTADDAKNFICERLGLGVDDVKWDTLKESIQKSTLENGPVIFRFKTSGETVVSLACKYSRYREEPGFSEISVNEFEPIPDTNSQWQKSFRIDSKGNVHLLVRVLNGGNLTPGREILEMVSDRDYVDARGIKVPAGLASMSEDEKKEFLFAGIKLILAKSGVIEKPADANWDVFPSSFQKEEQVDTPLLNSENKKELKQE